MRNDGIFFLTSGAPQGGAALAPYKGFAGGGGAGLVPARRRAGVGIGPYGRSAGGHKGRPYKEDTMRYKTRSTPQPVSYTHLDVYKRQMLGKIKVLA